MGNAGILKQYFWYLPPAFYNIAIIILTYP